MTRDNDANAQLTVLKKQLRAENADYMRELRGYLLCSNVFSEESEVITQLVQIYSDVLEAQAEGVSAEAFLGSNPKEMADQLSQQFSRQRPQTFLRQSIWLFSIFELSSSLVSLGFEGVVRFSPWLLLADLVIVLLVPWLLFGLRHTFYRSKGEDYRTLLLLGGACAVLLLARGFLQSQVEMTVLSGKMLSISLLILVLLFLWGRKALNRENRN